MELATTKSLIAPLSSSSHEAFFNSTPNGEIIQRTTPVCPTEGLIDAYYTYDGSLEGMFSAIFTALTSKDSVCDIAETGDIQPRLGQSIIDIPTSSNYATRLRNFILRAGGYHAFSAILYASLADNPNKALAIYNCISYAMTLPELQYCAQCPKRQSCLSLANCPNAKGSRSRQTAGLERHLENFAHPACGEVATLSRYVANERHKMKQFLRFEQVEEDLWFARCNPRANVIPLLMDFFAARFGDQRFVIYDEAHNLAGICDGKETLLTRTTRFDAIPKRTPDELTMRKAWKAFYHTASIEARYHPELRTSFMPKRLWKNILEVNEPKDFEPNQKPTLPPLTLKDAGEYLSQHN